MANRMRVAARWSRLISRACHSIPSSPLGCRGDREPLSHPGTPAQDLPNGPLDVVEGERLAEADGSGLFQKPVGLRGEGIAGDEHKRLGQLGAPCHSLAVTG